MQVSFGYSFQCDSTCYYFTLWFFKFRIFFRLNAEDYNISRYCIVIQLTCMKRIREHFEIVYFLDFQVLFCLFPKYGRSYYLYC